MFTGPPSGMYPTQQLFGVPIAAVSMQTAIDFVQQAITRGAVLQIGVVNAAKIVNMSRDAALRESVLSSDIVFADGMSVVWASRLVGRPLPARVAGIDLMMGILDLANTHRYRVFCLGATDEVLAATVDHIRDRFPHVIVAGSRNGYFGSTEEAKVAEQIANSGADILFVAMTSPKKEQFLARWSSILGVRVCHGVGGSFDVLAGKVRRAPVAWQRLGLEWLYRVKQEPGRLWRRYLVTNAMFCWLTLKEVARVHLQPLSRSPLTGRSRRESP